MQTGVFLTPNSLFSAKKKKDYKPLKLCDVKKEPTKLYMRQGWHIG